MVSLTPSQHPSFLHLHWGLSVRVGDMQVLMAPPAPFQASFFTSSITGAGFLLEPVCCLLGSFTLASWALP